MNFEREEHTTVIYKFADGVTMTIDEENDIAVVADKVNTVEWSWSDLREDNNLDVNVPPNFMYHVMSVLGVEGR